VLVALVTQASLAAEDDPRAGAASNEAPAGRDAPQRVRFSFSEEEWLGVLQWFADAAGANLDWQELPDDKFNLTTQREYSITEAHDVINLHLLARGFTLLSRGDVLFLVKLDENLNPALIPRVTPEELDSRGRYEYCKVSFSLDWMLAETAVEELRPMLSPYGKITPFSTTNRVEAMDAAINLREVRDLLAREQSDNSQERLVEEFVLEHANATEVLEKLRQILGMEAPLGRMSRDEMRAIERQYEFRAEMIKELGDKTPGLNKENEADVYLVANERKNSILANAAPDKIAIIRQAILALDVPTDGVRLDEVTTMKVYPLNGAEAEAVAEILEELRNIGKLHPSARFTEDDDRQILFAYASLQDHLTIGSVMDQLAGSARTFKVIPLTRLKATYVAESIRTLMGGESESSGGGDWRDRWRRGRGGSSSNSGWSGFRVEPDPPNNRLFLFATDAELAQVEELLVKIGERSAIVENRSDRRIRVVDVSLASPDQTIEQLRELWPSVGDNPLRIDIPRIPAGVDPSSHGRDLPAQEKSAEDLDKEAALDRASADAVADGARAGHSDTSATGRGARLGFASLAYVQESPQVPPVTIRQGPNGELILSSDDAAALDEMEQLIRELLPEQRPYTVFRLQHASPYSVQLTLEEIFASDAVRATAPIRFVSDTNTKSIMVFGAGPRELREIEELIRFYDQPVQVHTDPQTARQPRFFEIRHAQAESVATVLKDIYRDLLSANDRALAEERRRDENGRSEVTYIPPVPTVDPTPRFKGMLSIGVFPETNSLIVSAPKFLTDEIAITINELDRPQASTVTRVVAVGGVNPAAVAQLLSPQSQPGVARPAVREERPQENGRRFERQPDEVEVARNRPNGRNRGEGQRARDE
jgi:type II secretory pathway component GspD/PulD (secretin)